MVIIESQQPVHRAGFLFRPARMGDAASTAGLINACSLSLTGRQTTELGTLITEWRTPGFDLKKSTQVVLAPDGRLVGYIEVWDLNDLPVTMRAWGRVHPEFRHRGIGTELMIWAEARAEQSLDRVPPDAKVTLYTDALSRHVPANRLFEKLGYREARRFREMLIELDQEIPDPKWPDRVHLRSFAERPDLATVYQALIEGFKDHWGFVEQPGEGELQRWRHWIENDRDFDPTLWFLATDGQEIVGLCLCRSRLPEDKERAHVDELCVLRPWRRQGLALAMLHHAFGELKARGRRRVSLGVDATSLTGANRLYEKAGMHVEHQYTTFEKTLRPGRDLRTLG